MFSSIPSRYSWDLYLSPRFHHEVSRQTFSCRTTRDSRPCTDWRALCLANRAIPFGMMCSPVINLSWVSVSYLLQWAYQVVYRPDDGFIIGLWVTYRITKETISRRVYADNSCGRGTRMHSATQRHPIIRGYTCAVCHKYHLHDDRHYARVCLTRSCKRRRSFRPVSTLCVILRHSTLYASCVATIPSNMENSSLSRLTISNGVLAAQRLVNWTMSTNLIDCYSLVFSLKHTR